MANEGFLDLIPHQGNTVHQITKEEAEPLYEIREIIELGALGKAVSALAPKKLEELEGKKRVYENAAVE